MLLMTVLSLTLAKQSVFQLHQAALIAYILAFQNRIEEEELLR